jgi:hypothetical protein
VARVLVLNTDMSIEVRGANDKELQKIVGGYVEIVTLSMGSPLAHYVGIAVNDNGRIDDLETNRLATSLCSMFCMGQDTRLVGPAVLLANDPFDAIDLPQQWIDLVQALKAVVE